MTEDASSVSACCEGQSWCAVTCTTEVLSRKWHTVIVHRLLSAGPLGFNELKHRIEGISGKVLSESLDDLADKDLVEREIVSDSPRRVEYELTPAGEDLQPVIEAMQAWGRKHLDPVQTHDVGVEDLLGNELR